ncbi:hypothetical protein DICPUDRAFT_148277 [Dictyostelium purpureum]|uniref:U3 small nucleolar RNA-associated protein 11 n=1 Tax=Dictyostelium purpureum TaxID=5786 RepID=F0ZAP7_DICPU|nr:uncharacterized protein DICPUDRAFT_148277 [Dictyostelium purpureum]EGC38956.1 hypothetical protein DICPUDRAFT_148277 [Dictyostelium purpureum]|eukprot:XP_003284521.1 hypothetical protein DICPUDRAFT_148277 [Dictyostelium purpureum]
MTSMNLRRLLPNKAKSERPQPENTLKKGFLERKKDYIERARDYSKKKETIKKLKLQAAFKNPEEFSYKMISSKLVDGVHSEISKTSLKKEQIIDIKTQDILYLQSKRKSEDNKIERLQANLQYLDSIEPNEQVIYLDNEKDVKNFSATKYFDTVPEAFDGSLSTIPKLSKLKEGSLIVNKKTAPALGELESMTTTAYKELNERKHRRDQLFKAETELAKSKIQLKRGNSSGVSKKVGKKEVVFKQVRSK